MPPIRRRDRRSTAVEEKVNVMQYSRYLFETMRAARCFASMLERRLSARNVVELPQYEREKEDLLDSIKKLEETAALL